MLFWQRMWSPHCGLIIVSNKLCSVFFDAFYQTTCTEGDRKGEKVRERQILIHLAPHSGNDDHCLSVGCLSLNHDKWFLFLFGFSLNSLCCVSVLSSPNLHLSFIYFYYLIFKVVWPLVYFSYTMIIIKTQKLIYYRLSVCVCCVWQ